MTTMTNTTMAAEGKKIVAIFDENGIFHWKICQIQANRPVNIFGL